MFSLPSYWRNTSQWSTEGSEAAMHHEKLILWFGMLREMLWPMKTLSTTCFWDYSTPTLVCYHTMDCWPAFVIIVDVYTCVGCENVCMCIQRCSYVHKVIICFCHKLKTLFLFIERSFPSYLCSDVGQAAYLIGRFSMLYMHGRMSRVTRP